MKHCLIVMLLTLFVLSCEKPNQKIELRSIRDVVVDANTDPILKANATFFNPNSSGGKLKKIKVDIFVDGKRAGSVDQELKTKIPSNAEFTVPLEVKLALKELGFMNTVLGVLGGKKFEMRYEGFLKVTYKGIPIHVPVNYKDQVKIKF